MICTCRRYIVISRIYEHLRVRALRLRGTLPNNRHTLNYCALYSNGIILPGCTYAYVIPEFTY